MILAKDDEVHNNAIQVHNGVRNIDYHNGSLYTDLIYNIETYDIIAIDL